MSDLFYMSFCDPDRPKGLQFLGVCIVPASNEAEAMTASHLTGCNPGGEVAMIGPIPASAVRDGYTNRLLTAEEAEAAGRT